MDPSVLFHFIPLHLIFFVHSPTLLLQDTDLRLRPANLNHLHTCLKLRDRVEALRQGSYLSLDQTQGLTDVQARQAPPLD